jgi:hypothetical protein
MCKKMQVIPVNRVMNTKRIIGRKIEGRGEVQGVAEYE